MFAIYLWYLKIKKHIFYKHIFSINSIINNIKANKQKITFVDHFGLKADEIGFDRF